jgi:hypothetical protein
MFENKEKQAMVGAKLLLNLSIRFGNAHPNVAQIVYLRFFC